MRISPFPTQSLCKQVNCAVNVHSSDKHVWVIWARSHLFNDRKSERDNPNLVVMDSLLDWIRLVRQYLILGGGGGRN